MALYHKLEWGEIYLVNEFLCNNENKEKLIIFDIGTNRGLFVDLFVNKLDICEVHCFEPIQSLYNDLVLKYNGEKNIILNNIGICNYNGTSIFNELKDLETDGCSSIIERPVFKERGWDYTQYEIFVKTIDSYCDENKIDFIDFVKIDVEGCETLVFEGMLKLIESKRVGVIQFEYGATFLDGGFSLRSILDLAIKNGYILGYCPFGIFIDISESNFEEVSRINSVNLIFKKND